LKWWKVWWLSRKLRARRTGAANSLAELGSPRAVKLLVDALYDDRPICDSQFTNARVCGEASRALTIVGGPAVGHLLNKMHDADPNVRSRIICVLGRIGDQRAVEPLVQMMSEESNLEIQRHIVASLGTIKDPRAVVALGHALDTFPFSYRSEVVQALGYIGHPAAIALRVLFRQPQRQFFGGLRLARSTGFFRCVVKGPFLFLHPAVPRQQRFASYERDYFFEAVSDLAGEE